MEDYCTVCTLAKVHWTTSNTVYSIVGRTATQCLERYQKLLDENEQRESGELGLGGPGVEAAAPSADDVRKLRAGELDPDPESKPARPDTVDLDEDEKGMSAVIYMEKNKELTVVRNAFRGSRQTGKYTG